MRSRVGRTGGTAFLIWAALFACTGAGPAALAGEFMFMPTAAAILGMGSTADPTLEKRQLSAELSCSGNHSGSIRHELGIAMAGIGIIGDL